MLTEIHDSFRYRVVRKIADGGMGTVYKAVQLGTDGFEKVVALKMILDDLAKDPEFLEMFIGEAKLAADLVHQNIVQIYNLGRWQSSYYMAMEYCNGINLDEFAQRHRELGIKVPAEIAAFIISRVCRALDYAHGKRDSDGKLLGVVHRDISPKNVLLTMEGVIKLTDFGIAKAGQVMKSREGDVLYGKIQYMSPEQAQYRVTDRRSDIFSLGIVFYELLTCSELFDGMDTREILSQVITEPIPDIRVYRPDLPHEVIEILYQALERDLELRYSDAGVMGYDLEHFMYHDRFGPTNVTVAQYLAKFFPSRIAQVRPVPGALSRVSKRFNRLRAD